jgi:type IV pilus assembly protein PilB
VSEPIFRSRVGQVTYLVPAGSLTDPAAVAALEAELASAVAALNIHLVVDLAPVQTIAGKALELMLDAHLRLAEFGGELRVVNPPKALRELLHATGVADYLAEVDAASGESRPAARPVPGTKNRRLGEILLATGALSQDRLEQALHEQSERGTHLGRLLVEKGWLSESQLLDALSQQLGIPHLTLRPGCSDSEALSLLPREAARRMELLPMFRVHRTLTVATADPQAIQAFDEVERITGCRLRLVLARREEIINALADAGAGDEVLPDLMDGMPGDLEVVESLLPDDYTAIDELAAGSPVINLVNSIIQRAIREKASDIHLEPGRTRGRVRFRIDGLLYEVMPLRPDLHPAVVSRLKVMANLDIAERRLPQDGRIQVTTQGRTVDLRFSTLPGLFGEKVVLRVLDKNQSILELDRLGLEEGNLDRLRTLLRRSHGLILVTGPTGSGKTTTLYAAINHLKSIEKNIVTIEDPVEYQIEIINQNQVSEAVGLTFARMLKHVLRQDPDIIMVGEIRDRETAEIAVQAALTGHLVLSTLHTNSAVGAVSRMLDMEVEPYLLSAALIGVLAQRLVRRVCDSCRTTYLAPPELVERYGWSADNPIHLAKGRGCPACYDSGYRGRMAIHELLDIGPQLQRLIVSAPTQDELSDYLGKAGFRGLAADGLERALHGATTPEEIFRVVSA